MRQMTSFLATSVLLSFGPALLVRAETCESLFNPDSSKGKTYSVTFPGADSTKPKVQRMQWGERTVSVRDQATAAIDPKSGYRAQVLEPSDLLPIEKLYLNSRVEDSSGKEHVVIVEPRSAGEASNQSPVQRHALALRVDGGIEAIPVTEMPKFDPNANRPGGGRRHVTAVPGANTIVQTPKRGVFLVGTKTGELKLVRFGRDAVTMSGLEQSRLSSQRIVDGIHDPIILPKIRTVVLPKTRTADLNIDVLTEKTAALGPDAIVDLTFIEATTMHARPPARPQLAGRNTGDVVPVKELPRLQVTRKDGRIQIFELSIEQWHQIVAFGK